MIVPSERGRAAVAIAMAFAVFGAAAVGLLAGRAIPRDPRAPGEPRETTVILPTATAAIPAPALAALPDGRLAYADGRGRIFVLEGAAPGLTLTAAYAVREDRRRHLDDPAARAASGFYLDDLGAEGERDLARAREAFDREIEALAIDTRANERAEARARALLEAGDATFLLGKLGEKRSTARRAAALALGEAGFAAAAPALAEIAAEEARARALLERLAGQPIPDRAAFEAWWGGLTPAQRAAWRRW